MKNPKIRPQPVRRGVALTSGLATVLVACALAAQVHGRIGAVPPAATASWPEERRFAGAVLDVAAGARDGAFEEAGVAPVVADGQPGVLDANGALAPVVAPAGCAVVQVVPGGQALARNATHGALYVLRGGAPLACPAPVGFIPEGKVSGVRLSRDGRWLAWAGSVRDGRFERSAIVLADVDGAARRVVPLGNADALWMAQLTGVDVEAERVELTDAFGSSLTLDLDGQIVSQSLRDREARRAVQVGAGGRAVWGTAPGATLEWSTAFGAGRATLPPGATVGSVSIAPDGKRIAYTVWPGAKGDAALVVVSATTGAEELRRYAGRTRPAASFLGSSRLAVSPAGADAGGVIVLRAPGAGINN